MKYSFLFNGLYFYKTSPLSLADPTDGAECLVEMPSKMPVILKAKLKTIGLHAPELIAPGEDQQINSFAWVSGKEEDPSILCNESFNGTWLQKPLPRSSDGEAIGDWVNFKKNLPNSRGGKSNRSYVPPFDLQRPGVDKMRSPVFPVPFSFSDPQCKNFFENKCLVKENVFPSNVNPSPLARGHELKADASQKSLASIEALIKESLAQNLGNLSLINYLHKSVVENLKVNSTDSTLTLWESILTLVGASLTRNKQLLTSALARLREFIRAQALRKLQGNRHSKITADSWHFSNFGSQDLFGPVRSEVASWLNNFACTGSGQDTSLRMSSSASPGTKGGQGKWGFPSSSFGPENSNFRKAKHQAGRRRGGGAPQKGSGLTNQNQAKRGGKKGS